MLDGIPAVHVAILNVAILYLVENGGDIAPEYDRKLVLGSEPLMVNQVIKEICDYLQKKVYLQIPLPIWLANIFIKVFNIQMAEWDYFCLNYRHFTYEKFVKPETFGMTAYAPNIKELLAKSKV